MKQKSKIIMSCLASVMIASGLLSLIGIGAGSNKTNAAGGSTAFTIIYGVTRDQLVAELSAHAADSYYLGTPYTTNVTNAANGQNTYQNRTETFFPHGRMSDYNNTQGMAYGGFVKAVLLKIKPDSTAAGVAPSDHTNLLITKMKQQIVDSGTLNQDYFQYNSVGALLSSGKAHKGDIIYVLSGTDNLTNFGTSAIDDAKTNIGFFWGDTSGDNKYWLSDADTGAMRNQISTLKAQNGNTINGVVLIPTDVNQSTLFAPAINLAVTNQEFQPGPVIIDATVPPDPNWPTGQTVEYCLSLYGPYATKQTNPSPDSSKLLYPLGCKNMSPTEPGSFEVQFLAATPGYYYIGVSVDASSSGHNGALSSLMTGGYNVIMDYIHIDEAVVGGEDPDNSGNTNSDNAGDADDQATQALPLTPNTGIFERTTLPIIAIGAGVVILIWSLIGKTPLRRH